MKGSGKSHKSYKGKGLSLSEKLAIITGIFSAVGFLLIALLGYKGTAPGLLILLSLIFATVLALILWQQGASIQRGIATIALSVSRLARGDFSVRFRGLGFKEGGRLARQLEELTANLKEGVVEEKLAEIREREARLLGSVREKLMPKSFPKFGPWDIDGIFIPGKRGGGDFLGTVLSDNTLYLYVGSAQGAGASAGMLMVLAKTLLSEWLGRGEKPPQVLEKLNKSLKHSFIEGACLTLTMIQVSKENKGKVIAWGMGLQAPLYFFGMGKVKPIQLEGIALGLDEGPVFAESLKPTEIMLNTGQRLAMVTPGIFFNLSPNGEEFGEKRLEDAILKHGPKNTEAFVTFVMDEIEEFLGGEDPDEDIVLLSIRYNG